MPGLILIPWHIGDRRDLTLGALKEIRRLRCFLAEDPDSARREFQALLPREAADKRFLRLPETRSAKLLSEVLELVRWQDVGVVASGGAPCFVDPGAWLVRELRRREIPIAALAGPSCLSTVLSLSGLQSTGRPEIAGVLFYADKYSASRSTFAEAFVRQGREQPAVVLLRKTDFEPCLKALLPAAGKRAVSVFFDLTKPKKKFPYAGQVSTWTCAEWLKKSKDLDWARVSEISVVVHPL